MGKPYCINPFGFPSQCSVPLINIYNERSRSTFSSWHCLEYHQKLCSGSYIYSGDPTTFNQLGVSGRNAIEAVRRRSSCQDEIDGYGRQVSCRPVDPDDSNTEAEAQKIRAP